MLFEIREHVQPLYNLGGWYEADKKWKYEDGCGHVHFYWKDECKYPTLIHHEAKYETGWDDYYEEEYDYIIEPDYYECRICYEKIKPGTIHYNGPLYQIGETEFLIDGKLVTSEEYWKEFKNAGI